MFLLTMIYGVDYETRTLSGVAPPAEEQTPEELRCGGLRPDRPVAQPLVWDEELSVTEKAKGSYANVLEDEELMTIIR